MIKEFAFGLANRHYFQDASEVCNWMNMDKDTFMSLYDFDDHIKDFYGKKKSLSGYDGLVYIPDEFILDVDGQSFDDLENARQKTIGLTILLDDLHIPYKLYFSGNKGFHLGIPSTAFRWKPDPSLHLKVKDALKNAGVFDFADSSVTDKIRLIRVNNTKNIKSQLWKCEISKKLLNADDICTTMKEWAYRPRDVSEFNLECDPVFDVLQRNKTQETVTPEFISQGRSADPVNYPCISNMLNTIPMGERHATALRLASWFRWRYPENIVRLIMEDWRKQIDDKHKRFTEKEMESIIKNCYDGHDGAGYRYSCKDTIMDKHCKETCRIYKAKDNNEIMDAKAMEVNLLNFLSSDIEPINLSTLYPGEDFPIYPGEVVMIQAPPKSMKTMLLQNWMNGFKRPTYFIEMEMSPRQIWSRFVQIEMQWNESQLRDHYGAMRNGMDERFKWLTVDYSAPYPNEIEKRIMMLNRKPEIVVVDHMGLFKSKQRDPNMKTEEVSQALLELAVRQQVIIFAVSEITKSAFHEGMDLASSKGSFRTAYNANKVLSVLPYKDKQTGLIKALKVRSEANREREAVNVMLKLDNVNIIKDVEYAEG